MGRLGSYSLLLLAAAAALATGWLIPRLPGGWAVALGLFALALVLAILVRELSRAVPGELHLARARLGLKARRAPSIYIRRPSDSDAHATTATSSPSSTTGRRTCCATWSTAG